MPIKTTFRPRDSDVMWDPASLKSCARVNEVVSQNCVTRPAVGARTRSVCSRLESNAAGGVYDTLNRQPVGLLARWHILPPGAVGFIKTNSTPDCGFLRAPHTRFRFFFHFHFCRHYLCLRAYCYK